MAVIRPILRSLPCETIDGSLLRLNGSDLYMDPLHHNALGAHRLARRVFSYLRVGRGARISLPEIRGEFWGFRRALVGGAVVLMPKAGDSGRSLAIAESLEPAIPLRLLLEQGWHVGIGKGGVSALIQAGLSPRLVLSMPGGALAAWAGVEGLPAASPADWGFAERIGAFV
jgi:hypothetical protein